MKRLARIAVLALTLAAGAATAAERAPSSAVLIAAAKDARLDQIDVFRKDCGEERSVAEWLNDVLGDTAASVRWTGGKCRLINKNNPLDAGGGYCGHAAIVPKAEKQTAELEVFFEAPHGGKPGVPFAFRATVFTKDGWDYMRETYAFEVNWKLKYLPGYTPPANQECD